MGRTSVRSARVVVALSVLAVLELTWSSAQAATDTVTLGLPDRHLAQGPGAGRAMLDGLVPRFLRDLPCDGRKCPDRLLHVSVAVGSDYEILDWFGKGLLDLAVVPEISAVLLKRDVDFLEIGPDARGMTARPASPSANGALDAKTTGQLERYSQWVWCRARAELGWAERLMRLAEPRQLAAAACDGADAAGGPYRLEVFSHLHGLAGPIDVAARWLEAQLGSWQCPPRANRGVPTPRQAARAFLEDTFWWQFLHHTRFTFGREQPAPAASGPTRLRVSAGTTDRLIVSKRAAGRLGVAGSAERAGLPAAVERLWDRRCIDNKPGDIAARAPRPFRSLLHPEPTFGVRTFAFSARESVELLRRHRQRSVALRQPSGGEPAEEVELALVLPGGGVKAAYQSMMLERLYGLNNGQRLLRNAGVATAAAAPSGPLDVHYVIGTSGGALLGYFAARLTGDGPWHLDTALWQRCRQGHCRDLASTDVFGLLDLPRYVSAVTIYCVLALLLAICLALSMWHRALALGVGAAPGPAPPSTWRGRLIVSLAPTIVLMPFVIRMVNGDAGREHIPEIEGLFYAVFMLVTMFADECLIYRAGDVREPRKRRAGLVLMALGLLTVATPALTRLRYRQDKTWLDMPLLGAEDGGLFVQLGTLVVCLGGALLLVGAISWTAGSRGYRFVDVKGFRAGAGLGLLHILLVFVVVDRIVAMWPESGVSLLELTYEYWAALLIVAFASALLIIVARAVLVRWWSVPVLVSGIDYLSSNHPNGGIVPRRFVRLALLAVFGLSWWNLVIAPAVYGNASALGFLNVVESNFKDANGPATALTTRLIVTANVLEVDGARYFAFLPKAHDCLSLTRRTGYGAEWRVFPGAAGDAVPLLVDQSADCEKGRGPWTFDLLRHVVFASGSPYPVFPAHRVAGEDGRLVDGGYANNVPLDAAQAVGADQVLIVESSNPLGHEERAGLVSSLLGLVQTGDLVSNVPRLITFLWERSQQLDRISRRDLLVVSLAPRREETSWPSLVQFTGRAVHRLRDAAKRDFDEDRRIGFVQSWGRPQLINTVSVARPAPARAR